MSNASINSENCNTEGRFMAVRAGEACGLIPVDDDRELLESGAFEGQVVERGVDPYGDPIICVPCGASYRVVERA